MMGDELAAEVAISQTFGLSSAFTDRASMALKVLLESCFSGAKVALSPIICQDVVAAILAAGCTPIFVDVDPVTTEVPVDEWQRAHSSGARVAIVVHLFGMGRSLEGAREIFSGEDCLVVDDAAQALGTEVSGQLAGTQGNVGLLSFGHAKHMRMGGAAVLTQNEEWLDLLRRNRVPHTTSIAASLAEDEFRRSFNEARGSLAEVGREAAPKFMGLLEGYDASLHRAAPRDAPSRLIDTLPELAGLRQDRLRKDSIWRELLTGTGAVFYEHSNDSSLWRSAFRLPGIGWGDQAVIADDIRRSGVPLSTWYLPGHWFIDGGETFMKGAEQLSAEIFQLWIDEDTTDERIRTWAPIVRNALRKYAHCWGS